MSEKPKIIATPAQIIRSLCGIENWLKGVRKTLEHMDPDQVIHLDSHLPDFASARDNMPYVKGCPPPDIYTDDREEKVDVKGCPPPDWYQEDCR